ncbi:flagellar filament capping protein FliD [Rugamonas apoptosis]|uniref:Flagellar filament capping protein FliD n=1 Tax=Rugamonas apoptosis TaxID=2758570 RepID=A0A7W2F881_9BURK|nr:flagellar filament capping protein FliD [Rugamonas apoptosis]MBA5686932.1 flagellar filament capping protein FliD [Rugamonas apoptosis]
MATSPINASNVGTAPSTDVYNRVQQTLSSQNTGVSKLNATLARDQTRLSGLGQLHSALATFQAKAASLAGGGKASTTAPDATQTGKNVRAFVAAYNELNQKMLALQGGDLKGDVALGQVSRQMAQLLRTGGDGVSAGALAKAGVTLDGSGNLQVDDKKLSAALAADAGAVTKLFTNGGKGMADQLAAKAGAFTADNSVIRREASSLNKEITTINSKRAVLSKALTAQASALASLYSQQAQTGGGGLPGGTSGATGTAFDFLA